MSIILTGASGMLGHDIQHIAKLGNETVLPYTSSTLDIRNKQQVNVVLNQQKNVRFLINCAAYTNVDGAETDKDEAFAVNATGVRHLANWCKENDVTLVHFSTDYVFDGNKKSPYVETDPCQPINVYGESKLAGEIAIQESGCKAYIFRIQWLFGDHGKHFISTISKLARERRDLSIISDQWGSPSWTMDIARAVLAILHSKAEYGIYHLASQDYCNWADYARLFIDAQSISCQITDIPTSAYPTPAARPLNSRLNLHKFLEVGVYSPMRWQDGVLTFLRSRT